MEWLRLLPSALATGTSPLSALAACRRMEKYYWNPTREDRIGVCTGIFQHDNVNPADVEKLVGGAVGFRNYIPRPVLCWCPGAEAVNAICWFCRPQVKARQVEFSGYIAL
jgi:hypothetical protein